jgi:DNA-binding NarL/FixJ family response regulator
MEQETGVKPGLTRRGAVAKPRVLLVDDHPGVIEKVAALLADQFDVAGVATDPRRAVDAAKQAGPDVIVLDINMPGLNGFQTKRELDSAGSKAPIVFLSAEEDDDLAIAAFRCGGRGFVRKSTLWRDLATALDQVLAGRWFVPSLTSLIELDQAQGHAMHLYGDHEKFVDGLADFFGRALSRGDATCVMATEDVRDGVRGRLREAGWDVGGPSGHTRCLMIDATDAINRFMRNGLPDALVLAEIAAELDAYRRAVSEDKKSRLTLFGNMASSLIANDNLTAAITLETVWGRLTDRLPFFTVCGYPASCLQENDRESWSQTYVPHTAVSHAPRL